MSSHVKSVEERTIQNYSLSLSKRFLFIIVICCIQLIYIPTSNRIDGGIEPKLALDVFPVWPVWVIPYVLCYPLWLGSFLWAMFKMDDRMFRSFIMAFIITCAVSVTIFITFPTYVPRAAFSGSDVFTSLLRFIHENWGRYNALPSGHIYITAMFAFFYIRWHPGQKLFWTLILVIVSLSTLFTAQHYVVDILGGLLVALIGYYLGVKRMGITDRQARAGNSRLHFPPPS